MLVCALIVAGCGSGDGGRGQRELNSVMVGSEVVISQTASDFVDLAGLVARTVAGDLDTFWAAEASGDVEAMHAAIGRVESSVSQLSGAFGTVTDGSVRATYSPVLRAHTELLDALDDIVEGIDGAEVERRADGVADYAVVVDELAAVDRLRLDRVIAAYGPDEARRLLAAERGVGEP